MEIADLLTSERVMPALRAPSKKQALQELSRRAAEITGLAEQFNQRGTAGLVAALERRTAAARATRGLYLLTDARYRPVVGNLSRWPDGEPDAEGWITFPLEYRDPAGPVADYGRARIFRLRGGRWSY